MSKEELITLLAGKLSSTKTDADNVINQFRDSLIQLIKEHNTEGFRIAGFGTFIVRKRAARKGKNPKTGAVIDIAERLDVCFKPSKTLKETINEKKK